MLTETTKRDAQDENDGKSGDIDLILNVSKGQKSSSLGQLTRAAMIKMSWPANFLFLRR